MNNGASTDRLAHSQTGDRAHRNAVLAGVWWMTGAALFFAMIYVAGRELSGRFSIYEIVFYQTLIAALCMTPWAVRAGKLKLGVGRPGIYLFRAVWAVIAYVTMFYGVKHLSLANATALLFTTPLWTVLFASLFLRERAGARRWGAVAVGFIGALIVIRPDVANASWAVPVMVLSAAAFAVVNATTRLLTRTENLNAMVFFGYVLMVPLVAGPALYDPAIPVGREIMWIIAIGVLTVCAQQCITRSLAAAPPSIVMPAHYLQLLFAAGFGFAAYGEIPEPWIWAGAIVICGSTYSLARIESRAIQSKPSALT